jgi:hypothetical protein
MQVESYQKRLEEHLADYRMHRLGVRETGTYRDNGKHYGYILPPPLKWLNIPEAFRREIRTYAEARKLKTHVFFHHMNSSQAFALGLFYPFLAQATPNLAAALGVEPISTWNFEVIVDANEETNVDVWWKSVDDHETYCEVKLSESGFGKAKSDGEHVKKLARTYRPVLEGKVDDLALEPKHFFGVYQILRNVWLAARKGHERDQVIFVLPEANEALVTQLNLALKWVLEPLRSRVRIVYVESVLEKLVGNPDGRDALSWYARQLQEKYVLRIGDD